MAGTCPNLNSSVEDGLQLLQTLLACGRDLRRQLADVTRPTDLNDTQFLLLWSCSHEPSTGISQRDLVKRLGISPAQMSALVEGLRRRDLLVAERCPKDRRRQIWCLTPDGEAIVASATTALQPWADNVASSVGRHDLLAMAQALASVEPTLRVTRGAA